MKGRDQPVNLQAFRPVSHVIIDIPNDTTVSDIPLSMARSTASHLHPRNGWERNSTSMGPRYIVRHFDDQRGYYSLLCNMVTLQSLRSFSLSVLDKSNPINRCHGNETLPRPGYSTAVTVLGTPVGV